jgi:Ca2+-binding EF-hand superfamily protein
MEPRLTPGGELAPLERLFAEVDLEKTGRITRKELSKVRTRERDRNVRA